MMPAAPPARRLGREVVVAGVRDHVEIWDRAAWREELSKWKGVPKVLPNALQPNESDHVAVLAEEVRELLAVEPGETVVDATFGAGGHAAVLAADLKGDGRFMAIDRDPTVRPYFEGFQAPRRRADTVLARRGLGRARSAGRQRHACRRDPARPRNLEHAGRPAGAWVFVCGRRAARHAHGPDGGLSAAELVNEATERELVRSSGEFGEERYSRQIARAIVKRRRDAPIERTGELVDTIRAAMPAPGRFGDGHPAKRVFQALRIAVNDELGSLEGALRLRSRC